MGTWRLELKPTFQLCMLMYNSVLTAAAAACRVTHRLKLTAPEEAAAAAAVQQPGAVTSEAPAGQLLTGKPAAAAAAAAAAQEKPRRHHGPLESARKRFKRLLSVLACGGQQSQGQAKDSSATSGLD
jgi:hypothetical protein